MVSFQVELSRSDSRWAVKVVAPSGIEREYRYRSLAQARYFAAVFALGPSFLPPSTSMSARRRRKQHRSPRPLAQQSVAANAAV